MSRPIRTTWKAMLLGAWLAVGAGCGSEPRPVEPSRPTEPAPEPDTPDSERWFEDLSGASGITHTYRNGEEAGEFTILESLGGGLALLDYDGDGLLDVFVTGGGTLTDRKIAGLPCKLYRNRGGFRFEDVSALLVIETGGWGYTHGAAAADYDRDGWPDLAITGYGWLRVLHNEAAPGGGRRFRDVTKTLGVVQPFWAASAAWADFSGTGFPDLYVCEYVDWSFANHPSCESPAHGNPRDVCPPQRFKPLVHKLYRNHAGKSLQEMSTAWKFPASGCGLGVLAADLNEDGKPDAYVANDASNNFLLFNRNGRLVDEGMASGTAVDDTGRYNGSMGVDAADFDGTGRASLWVTNFQGELHGLYRSLGGERFQHVSRARGIGSFGLRSVGFGTAFIDADHDGWEDIVVANGHVLHHALFGSPLKQPPHFLHNTDNNGSRSFKEIGASISPWFRQPTVGRGLACGDLDNDGWADFLVVNTNAPVSVLRNRNGSRNLGARWIGVRLAGKDHRDITGSTVVLDVGDRKLTRFAKNGGSYLSSSDPRFLFGLGSTMQPNSITVKWSWGGTQTWRGLEPGHYWELREDDPEPKKVTSKRG